MSISTIIALIGEAVGLVSIIIPVFMSLGKIKNGMRCQLRSDMLQIYYHNREDKTVRQFEYENFVALYEAYKALKGNSFIDKIYKEVQTWEVIS